MPIRALSKILVLLFGLMLVLPSFSAKACHAGKASHSHHQKSQVAKNQKPLSHEKNCNCPLHFMGCCHSGVAVQREAAALVFAPEADLNLYSYQVSIRPEPVLDGPFQPPRA